MQHMWHGYEDQDSFWTVGIKVFQSGACCRDSMFQAFLDMYLLQVIF